MPVTTEMSESSSIHSSKLVSLAQSLSGLGLDAANGDVVNPPDNDEPPPPVGTPLNATHSHPTALKSCKHGALAN